MLHVHCQSRSLFYFLILISEKCASCVAPHFVFVSILLLLAGTLPIVLLWNSVWRAKFHTRTKHTVEQSMRFERRKSSANFNFVSTNKFVHVTFEHWPVLHWLYFPPWRTLWPQAMNNLLFWEHGFQFLPPPNPPRFFIATVPNPIIRADVLQQATTVYFQALSDPPCLKLNNLASWYVSTWNEKD